MKKYRVKVNGSVYEIELEEISGNSAANAPKEQTYVPEKPAQSAQADGETVQSPMPGNILSVNVTEGQSVSKGDVLMVLEAMKMENEIMAPVSGKVTGVVAKGSTVGTGDVLCTIK